MATRPVAHAAHPDSPSVFAERALEAMVPEKRRSVGIHNAGGCFERLISARSLVGDVAMTREQLQHIADRYRRLAMHEGARGHRRLALRYVKLAHEHECRAIMLAA